MSRRYELLKPLLFRLEPGAGASAWRSQHSGRVSTRAPAEAIRGSGGGLLGLDFPNPIGVAAGLDKNGEVPDALLALGFGFVEIGTVTPLPQAGNPDAAALPPCPSTGQSSTASASTMKGMRRWRGGSPARPRRGIVGVNLGANRDAADRVADYVAGVTRFAGLADYLTINISSPNTPGPPRPPGEGGAGDAARSGRRGARRPSRAHPRQDRPRPRRGSAGGDRRDGDGLGHRGHDRRQHDARAGRDQRTAMPARPAGCPDRRSSGARRRCSPVSENRSAGSSCSIGVGGVDSAETAFAKIAAGADLVQLYTGLDLSRTAARAEDRHRPAARSSKSADFPRSRRAVGIDSERWAAEDDRLI